ncbi:MAG: zinc-dependent metalloprotease [Rubrivivax sp.]|nr:zinc-dependent metalloprotease [Rubrivivax sp.]
MRATASPLAVRSLLSAAACLALAGCAQLAGGPGSTGPAAAAAGAAAPGSTPAPAAGATAAAPASGKATPAAPGSGSAPATTAATTPATAPPAGAARAGTPPAAAAAGQPPGSRPAAAPGAAAGAAAATAPAAPPAPGSLPPFDVVAKDARKTEGLFTVWRKDDKAWLELKPEDFDKPFFLSTKIARGIGEKWLFGGLMIGPWGFHGQPQIVEFRRVQNQVRLIAVNTEYVAKAGTPEARAVASSFSNSLMASSGVVSAPHPERKTVLVDAQPLFLNDLSGLGMMIQRQFRQGYGLDPRHTGIDNVRGTPDAVIVDLTQHFYTASLATPMPGQPPGLPTPLAATTVPDARSFFVGINLSISRLPDTPMAPRRADARIGTFVAQVNDFSGDAQRTPRQRFVMRWRLEKKDPAAELSEPVKPVTYWLDRNIPLAYRAAITEGVLEWNKAFEKIGLKNAIVVRQQSDTDTFDTLDPGVASIRWMASAEPRFGAIGPSHVDPRSGEILDADIGIEGLSARNLRSLRSQVIKPGFSMDWAGLLQARDAAREGSLPVLPQEAAHQHSLLCRHGEMAAEQLGYALDVLEARGELEPDSPDVQQFVLDYLKETTMHEVGHTLGLRHNFRSSRVYSESQLADEEFTRREGLSGSVMEYAPINLPRPGQRGGLRWQLTLGPYDYWAIEYAYRPLDPATEAAELQRIASRSAEPQLAYGSDEDSALGIDPETLVFDLGSDPVAFAKKRFEIGRDIVARQDSRPLKTDANYALLRRSVVFAVRDMARASGILARQIGGLRTLRDHPGSGRDPLTPVDAAVQREALEALAKGVLAADSLTVSPMLRRKLAPDYFERIDSFGEGTPLATDLSVDDLIGQLRKAVLAQLMSDGVATRILENTQKLPAGDAFRLSELYARLTREIWSDLDSRDDISAPRRELQREHVNRLAAQMLRPASSRTDSRSLLRLEAQSLTRRLAAAGARRGLSPEARAHLEDSRETLELALAAKLQRLGL